MADFSPINPLHGYQNIPPDNVRNRRRKERTEPSNEFIEKTNDYLKQEDLLEKLTQSGEVRPEMVELGRKLAQSPDFPSAETLDQLASALLSPVDEDIEEI